jgi:hypothetical protein
VSRRWRALEWRTAGFSRALSRGVGIVGRIGKRRTDWSAQDSAQRHDNKDSAHRHFLPLAQTDARSYQGASGIARSGRSVLEEGGWELSDAELPFSQDRFTVASQHVRV